MSVIDFAISPNFSHLHNDDRLWRGGWAVEAMKRGAFDFLQASQFKTRTSH